MTRRFRRFQLILLVSVCAAKTFVREVGYFINLGKTSSINRTIIYVEQHSVSCKTHQNNNNNKNNDNNKDSIRKGGNPDTYQSILGRQLTDDKVQKDFWKLFGTCVPFYLLSLLTCENAGSRHPGSAFLCFRVSANTLPGKTKALRRPPSALQPVCLGTIS